MVKILRQATNEYAPPQCNISYGRSEMSAHMLQVSLLLVGPVLHLEREKWSIVIKRLVQATHEYATSPQM